MNPLNTAIADFISTVYDRPYPIGTPTAHIVRALRLYLDEAVPGWRDAVFAAAPAGSSSFEVEFHLQGGDVIKGVLYQRPSAATGEAA